MHLLSGGRQKKRAARDGRYFERPEKRIWFRSLGQVTQEFVMSSSGFVPPITRPTRMTATSATLIDNILTNNLIDTSHSLQGLYIIGVSDHFPIFRVSRRMQMAVVDVHMYKNLYSLKDKKEFYRTVSITKWDEIDRARVTHQPLDIFHNQLTEL